MSTKNYEICHDLMSSYIESLVKIWLDYSLFSQMLLTNCCFSGKDPYTFKDLSFVCMRNDLQVLI